MKPTQILIPRLLPIFKHCPSTTMNMFNPSATGSLVNNQFTRNQDQTQVGSPSPQHKAIVESKEKVSQEGGEGWNTWWLPNPNNKQGNGTSMKVKNQSMNDHTHTQTSNKYHTPHHNKQAQSHITPISTMYDSVKTNTSGPKQDQSKSKQIRSKDEDKDKDRPNKKGINSNSTSSVPPATIAWNDYLSMV